MAVDVYSVCYITFVLVSGSEFHWFVWFHLHSWQSVSATSHITLNKVRISAHLVFLESWMSKHVEKTNKMKLFWRDGVCSKFFESAQVCFQSSDADKRLIEVIREACGAKQRRVIGADHHRVTLGHQHSRRVVPEIWNQLQHLQVREETNPGTLYIIIKSIPTVFVVW